MRLLVLDGNNLIHRAFYAIRPFSTKDGRFTNAIMGFLNIWNKLVEQVKPDGAAAAFDLPGGTFRNELYADYKAGRQQMPDELAEQLEEIQRILPLMGVRVVTAPGFEADDVMATLARRCAESGDECFLATGDKDAFQLVAEGATVLFPTTRQGQAETVVYDGAAVRERFGLEPAQLLDLKALMGDASDKIPGVPGIGEKTAVALLQQAGSLDALYADLDGWQLTPAVRRKLEAGRESAQLSRELGRLRYDAPVDAPADYALGGLPIGGDRAALTARLASLELFRLIKLWGLEQQQSPEGDGAASAPVSAPPLTQGTLAEVLKAAYTEGRLDLALAEEGGIWAMSAALAVYAETEASLFGDGMPSALADAAADPALEKRVHDLTALCRLMPEGVRPARVTMDTLLAGYLLNPLATGYALPRLAQEYGVGAGEKAAFAFGPLCARMEEQLAAEGQLPLLRELELPLAPVLADMEALGFAVDATALRRYGGELAARMETLQRAVWDGVGYEFNLNSPGQLAKALYDDLGLPAGKKTKTGYSTAAEELERLRLAHPAVAMLLEYRRVMKLKTTYCDGLAKAVSGDGRIHTTFIQTETRTGRISSAEPNLQNIPVRQPMGRELRRFFRAREGWVLIDADYSQIELRVLAHMAGEAVMLDAFARGEDIHRVTAGQVFGVPAEDVTPQQRAAAKAVNFGIVYGIGPYSLAQDLGVSFGEAKAYIEGYLAQYAGVEAFMQELVARAKERGYAETLYGRRRGLPELRSSSAPTRAFGERVARNMPVQGTAADIIKRAMVRADARLRAEGLRARLLLQVHDELLVEAPETERDRAAAVLREEMEGAAALDVKLEVDVGWGATWYASKG